MFDVGRNRAYDWTKSQGIAILNGRQYRYSKESAQYHKEGSEGSNWKENRKPPG